MDNLEEQLLMQLTFLRAYKAMHRLNRCGPVARPTTQALSRSALLLSVGLILSTRVALADDAFCNTPNPGQAPTVYTSVRLAPNRSVPGPAYPVLTTAQVPGLTMTCTGAPPHQTFWIGARGLQPGKSTSWLAKMGLAFITRNELRATIDGESKPGTKVAIGEGAPDYDTNMDGSFLGARVIANGVISCSGASGSAAIGDDGDSRGGGVAYLACQTDANGSMWVSRTPSLIDIYQASSDGAVGIVGRNFDSAWNFGDYLHLNPDAAPGAGALNYSMGILVSTSLQQIKSILNSSPSPTTTSCTGTFNYHNPLFQSTCSSLAPSTAVLYFGSQPEEPSVCTVHVVGGGTLTWADPIRAEQFSSMGGALAATKTTQLDIACTGAGASSLNTMTVLSLGAASPADATAFASSNPSVNYRVTAGTRETILAPNSSLTFGASDGVAYIQGAGAATASLPLAITPIAALPNPIPGRADTRVTLEVYAGL